jgi:hypothetical protein
MNIYDDTKRMLNIMRKLTESKEINTVLNEQEDVSQGDEQTQDINDNILVINDVDVKILSTDEADMKLLDDQKSQIETLIDGFKQTVSEMVNFEPGITIKENQIRMDGTLSEGEIKFVFISGEDEGAYIVAEMLKLDQNNALILEKLAKFQLTYKTTMDPILSDRKIN